MIYLPSLYDLKCLEQVKSPKEFWQELLQENFYLSEEKQTSTKSSAFNIEYAVLSQGKQINLSKDASKIAQAILKKDQPLKDLKILNSDLSIKLQTKTLREPIGFISRGDFSQARGHGMGIGLISEENCTVLKSLMAESNLKKGNGVIALFRNTTSLVYHPCWLFKAR